VDEENAKRTWTAIARALIRHGLAEEAERQMFDAFDEVASLLDRLGIPKAG
jgi:hypothetical protein